MPSAVVERVGGLLVELLIAFTYVSFMMLYNLAHKYVGSVESPLPKHTFIGIPTRKTPKY